ncbi:NAD(P)H-binding protein [Novosphingobium sp.]|uniref:NAD(P)H-binding protein n=1 Tax=Novosphingobium sp. TaxID=1874826 RepID=UPI003D0E15B6
MTQGRSLQPRRVFVIGATGTIGRATVRALVQAGHEVVCFVRPGSAALAELAGATIRFGQVTDAGSVARDGFRAEPFDALVSCLTSRTGAPGDAWAIDHAAHIVVLDAARAAGVKHMVLLSAICVQKPTLAFQQAKLAFEKVLIESGMDYSIVRATAFFKSLSGQIDRIRQGKSFLMFGDGTATACKPISDDDLAWFLTRCLDEPGRRNRILPIGGPGEAVTPRAQADRLFALLGGKPRFTRVPIALLDTIIVVLATLGRISPSLAGKAELARIGRYYATESMLVLDPVTGRYDAMATPSTGSETLFDFYAQVIAGERSVQRGEHAVF